VLDEIVLEELLAVVRGDHHQGVVQSTELREPAKELPRRFVRSRDLRVVARHEVLEARVAGSEALRSQLRKPRRDIVVQGEWVG
jgi:hypothetical protein